MRRKHYLVRACDEIVKGDAYKIAKYFRKSSETIKKLALTTGIFSFEGETYTIESFEHLYQFIDSDGYVVFEGTLHECEEEMCCSCQYIIASSCTNTKAGGYTIKAVEYLEGYGYYD